MDLGLYASTIHKTRYARWREDLGRREHWGETVERYVEYFEDMLKTRHNFSVRPSERQGVYDAIYNLDVMPSMRSLMTAGVALRSAEVANFNCSYLTVDTVRSFSEHMFVLMCGSGSGFSVESRFTENLPNVPSVFFDSLTTIHVADSRQGWCEAFDLLLQELYAGRVPRFDTSAVRPEGTRLKTFGGYASGPVPLEELFRHTIAVFRGAAGRKLRPIEVFSIFCYIAQIVVVGGVRRSATIALFDRYDMEMRNAKSGEWWKDNPHFAMANISAVFEDKPSRAEFDIFWTDMVRSRAGEPGILNREGLWKQNEKHNRANRDAEGRLIPFGVNPCSEIILRPNQFCNLTGVAIRPDDTLDTLTNKVKIAALLGTWQAVVTNFEYLDPSWKANCDEERLLGVCLAGIMDHPVLSRVSDESAHWLRTLRKVAEAANKFYALRVGIPVSAAVTSVKPAGNSGELYGVASGIHPRYAPYYIRTIRQSGGDPMTSFLKDNGIPWEVSAQNARDVVFSFPVKSPDGAVCARDVKALTQLNHWLHVKNHYTSHTVSCTIYYRPGEEQEVGDWVFEHFDDITGLSFLPYDDHTYPQAPYQPITKEKYEDAVKEMPAAIDWELLRYYEAHDTTTLDERACSGGKCELTVAQ